MILWKHARMILAIAMIRIARIEHCSIPAIYQRSTSDGNDPGCNPGCRVVHSDPSNCNHHMVTRLYMLFCKGFEEQDFHHYQILSVSLRTPFPLHLLFIYFPIPWTKFFLWLRYFWTYSSTVGPKIPVLFSRMLTKLVDGFF